MSAFFHEGSDLDPTGATAVLMCSPWGPDEVASYRPRRAWAERLAASGHPTLRFDLPATGDSTGVACDERLVDAWIGAIEAAGTWLRGASGADRVVALGLGLGGVLAREAIARGAVFDDLALWAAPATGKAFVKEARSFSRLQARTATPDLRSAPGRLGEGWLEVSGLYLSPETIGDLESLDPEPVEGSRFGRTLLMGRHGGKVPDAMVDRLGSGGARLNVEAPGGWSMFVSHPESARLPDEVVGCFEEWLSAESGGGAASVARATRSMSDARCLELRVGDTRVVESVFTADQPFGRLFGILAEPSTPVEGGLCAVYLNAGAIRHVGPNRMWVQRGRAWAAKGVPTLRVDLEGIGDGGGEPEGIPPGNEHFSPKFETQVRSILDALEQIGHGPSFLLVGLCSGAYHSFRTAVLDDRVKAAFMINAGALVFRPTIFAEREMRMNLHRVDGRRFKMLLSGKVAPAELASYTRQVAHGGLDSLKRMGRRSHRDRSGWPSRLQAEVEELGSRGVRLVFAFSGGEEMAEELDDIHFPALAAAWPGVEMHSLPGADHTLRPPPAQTALAEQLDAFVEREVSPKGLVVAS